MTLTELSGHSTHVREIGLESDGLALQLSHSNYQESTSSTGRCIGLYDPDAFLVFLFGVFLLFTLPSSPLFFLELKVFILRKFFRTGNKKEQDNPYYKFLDRDGAVEGARRFIAREGGVDSSQAHIQGHLCNLQVSSVIDFDRQSCALY